MLYFYFIRGIITPTGMEVIHVAKNKDNKKQKKDKQKQPNSDTPDVSAEG